MKSVNRFKAKSEVQSSSEGWGTTEDGWGTPRTDVTWENNRRTIPQDLLERVEANVLRMKLGLEPLHSLSSDEAQLLRPRSRSTFGVGPDGSILHCGTLTADLNELEMLSMNNEMRMRAGFPPQDVSRIRELIDLQEAGHRLLPASQRLRLQRDATARAERSSHRADVFRAHGRVRGLVRLLLERFTSN